MTLRVGPGGCANGPSGCLRGFECQADKSCAAWCHAGDPAGCAAGASCAPVDPPLVMGGVTYWLCN